MKKILAWWKALSCVCVQDTHSSCSPSGDYVCCPAAALPFSLVLVPLNLPQPISVSLLELNQAEAGFFHPVCISSLGFSLCWPGQPARCPWLLHPSSGMPETVMDHSGAAIPPAHFFPSSEYIFRDNKYFWAFTKKPKQNRKNGFFDSLQKSRLRVISDFFAFLCYRRW